MSEFSSMNEVTFSGLPRRHDGALSTVIDISNSQYSFPLNATAVEKCRLLQSDHGTQMSSKYTYYTGKIPVNLKWSDVYFRSKEGTTILNGLKGSSRGGELTAVMGPSGSGKTSFLNALSGFSQEGASGKILVNGVKREMHWFRNISAYILQDVHILPRFTVRELITFASRLKISAAVSEKERQKAIDDCLHSLGLAAQQNQRANTLSGGQRKRLCIAQEIVSNPPLIFLDEPTSGLDSASCLQCIQLLKSLAKEGRNIICTIHQPSSRIYNLFDNLYMICQGHCIYRGSTKNLLSFLAEQDLHCPSYYNPADFIMNIAIGVYGQQTLKLVTAIDVLDDYSQEKIVICNKENMINDFQLNFNQDFATSSTNQFKVLFERNFMSMLREPVNVVLKIIGNVVVGTLLGLLFYDTAKDAAYILNTMTLLTVLISFLQATALIPTIATFPLRRILLEREHRNGWYGVTVYYLAMSAAEVPFQIICPMTTYSLVFWLSGQPSELSRFFPFVLSGILVSLITESVALIISIKHSTKNGIYIGSAYVFYNMLLCGSVLPVNHTPVNIRLLVYLNYMRYGVQSMVLSIFQERQPLPCSKQFCVVVDHNEAMARMDMEGKLYFSIFVLFVFLALFRVISYWMLCRSIIKKK